MRLEKAEADQLAGAVADVAELYDIPAVSPEVIAWGNLIQTIGFVYGTRIMAARFARQAQQKAQPRPDARNSQGSTQPATNAPRPEPVAPAPSIHEPIYIDDPILGRIAAGGYAPPPPPMAP